jgi:hypothetical protein
MEEEEEEEAQLSALQTRHYEAVYEVMQKGKRGLLDPVAAHLVNAKTSDSPTMLFVSVLVHHHDMQHDKAEAIAAQICKTSTLGTIENIQVGDQHFPPAPRSPPPQFVAQTFHLHSPSRLAMQESGHGVRLAGRDGSPSGLRGLHDLIVSWSHSSEFGEQISARGRLR